MDSAASHHITPHQELFSSYQLCTPTHIFTGDDSPIAVVDKGSILFSYLSGGTTYYFVVHDVLHAPTFHYNLIPVGQLAISSFFFSVEHLSICRKCDQLPSIPVS